MVIGAVDCSGVAVFVANILVVLVYPVTCGRVVVAGQVEGKIRREEFIVLDGQNTRQVRDEIIYRKLCPLLIVSLPAMHWC